MRILTFIMYVLALAVVAAVLLWAGERLLAALRTRKRRRQRPPDTALPGDQTQYSMFSQAPIGDGTEYDPLAEAEIYVTYGNHQMAIDTLIKALGEHPEREDIAAMLAELQKADKA